MIINDAYVHKNIHCGHCCYNKAYLYVNCYIIVYLVSRLGKESGLHKTWFIFLDQEDPEEDKHTCYPPSILPGSKSPWTRGACTNVCFYEVMNWDLKLKILQISSKLHHEAHKCQMLNNSILMGQQLSAFYFPMWAEDLHSQCLPWMRSSLCPKVAIWLLLWNQLMLGCLIPFKSRKQWLSSVTLNQQQQRPAGSKYSYRPFCCASFI